MIIALADSTYGTIFINITCNNMPISDGIAAHIARQTIDASHGQYVPAAFLTSLLANTSHMLAVKPRITISKIPPKYGVWLVIAIATRRVYLESPSQLGRALMFTDFKVGAGVPPLQWIEAPYGP